MPPSCAILMRRRDEPPDITPLLRTCRLVIRPPSGFIYTSPGLGYIVSILVAVFPGLRIHEEPGLNALKNTPSMPPP